jgi:two-component system LytT family response regulator
VNLRVAIVDDEPVARRRIRRLLRPERGVTIVAECGDGAAAVQAVRSLAPDLIFLDVQMPELDGFEVLRALAPGPLPAVIFVTAYDRYAIAAFEVHALDYLLKPVSADRCAQAVARARTALAERRAPADSRLLKMLSEAVGRRWLTRLPVRAAGRVVIVDLSDVDWIQAADNYVTLHAGRHEHVLRETLARLEKELDPDRFVRIHRSAIVQVDRIRELRPAFHGDFVVVLRDGVELPLSRGYRSKVEQTVGRAL